jgi:hypothetical protein
MFRKSIVIGAAALGLGLSSCGDGMPTTMCECMEVQVEIMEKSMDIPIDDSEALQAVNDQYKAQQEACEKLGEAFDEKHKDASREDRKAAQEKELKDCAAMDRMEELYQQRMDQVKQQ